MATSIPYAWLATPLTRRPTIALNAVTVTATAGTVGTSINPASVTRYGASNTPITVDSGCTADPGNLAGFLTTYEGVPRPRQPTVQFQLLDRVDAECLTILSVGIGQRVQIVGAPASWPPGAANFIVQGIYHRFGVEDRLVEWATAACVGTSVTGGPWFTWGASAWDGPDVRPF